MGKFFTNTYPLINLHEKASSNSEIVSQMIYGDSFSVLKKYNHIFVTDKDEITKYERDQ